jgi:hypothetical protein
MGAAQPGRCRHHHAWDKEDAMNKPLQNIGQLVDASSRLEETSDDLPMSTKGLALAWALHAREEIIALVSEIVATTALKDYWGDDPHRPHPDAPAFNPRYIALLYLGLGDDWTLAVNHACYALPAIATTPDARRDYALDILEDKVTRGVTFGEQNLAGHPAFRHQKPVWDEPMREYDSGSLGDFKFKSPNEIFIFLHHEGFPLTFYNRRLIAFKQLGADNQVRRPNDTFYNARAVPNSDLKTLRDKGTLIRVENYATDVSGMLTDTLLYSMDIKFQINAGSQKVTMIIDPDTGNGTGNEP